MSCSNERMAGLGEKLCVHQNPPLFSLQAIRDGRAKTVNNWGLIIGLPVAVIFVGHDTTFSLRLPNTSTLRSRQIEEKRSESKLSA
jgi:hypothetical protein